MNPRAAIIAEVLKESVTRLFWILMPFLAAALFASAADAATGAERRVALVIGNSDYQYASHLPIPTNDAEAVEVTLQEPLASR